MIATIERLTVAVGLAPAVPEGIGRTFDRRDPECRRTLALLRLRRWQMRAAGMQLALDGRKVSPAAKTDVRRTWRAHGWRPGKPKRAEAA